MFTDRLDALNNVPEPAIPQDRYMPVSQLHSLEAALEILPVHFSLTVLISTGAVPLGSGLWLQNVRFASSSL